MGMRAQMGPIGLKKNACEHRTVMHQIHFTKPASPTNLIQDFFVKVSKSDGTPYNKKIQACTASKIFKTCALLPRSAIPDQKGIAKMLTIGGIPNTWGDHHILLVP